jgi:hypothetical protein
MLVGSLCAKFPLLFGAEFIEDGAKLHVCKILCKPENLLSLQKKRKEIIYEV